MLTAGQCRVVAYFTDGDVICSDCAEKQMEEHLNATGQDFDTMMDLALAAWAEEHGGTPDAWQRSRIYDKVEEARNAKAEEFLGLDPVIQYSLESGGFDDGLWCGDCNKELVEPYETEEDEE